MLYILKYPISAPFLKQVTYFNVLNSEIYNEEFMK
jgi:hypothetical protein